jgi:hypothetical protein
VPPSTVVPTTGAGGTYLYSASSPHGVTFSSQSASLSGSSANVSRLPATGGGAGTPNPASPLAPLGLLGALAIVAGSVFNRLRKR